MATVTELVDLICEDTGLNSGVGTADRLKALRTLNHAQKRIATAVNGFHLAFEIDTAAGINQLTVTDYAVQMPNFLAIDFMGFSDTSGGPYQTLPRRNPQELFANRSTTVTGRPAAYAFRYPYIFFSSTTSVTDILSGMFSTLGVPLVESGAVTGQETSPSMIPPAWHENLLAGMAKLIILEGYEGRETDAQYHRNIVTADLAEFKLWQIRLGGENTPNEDLGARWITPSPLRIR